MIFIETAYLCRNRSDNSQVMQKLDNSSDRFTELAWSQTGLLSTETMEIFHTVNFAILSAAIATFGIFANVVNIIVFLKQGFRDSVNVSLFALALSDLSALLVLQWINLLRNPLFYKSGVPLMPLDIFHLTGGWPHGFLARVTSWFTAYVTLERCLCVLIPLKIKRLVTPKLAFSVLTSIFSLNVLTLIPDYTATYIDWKFIPERNRTMLALYFKEHQKEMAVLSFAMAAYTQMIPFLAVIIFTTVLVIKMKQKSKWRASTAAVGQGTSKSSVKRDRRTVNMVILLAVIFSICLLPTNMTFLISSVVPGFEFGGRYHNSFLVCWSFAFMVDSINSSVNIFVYYRMSSKYRLTLLTILNPCRCAGPGVQEEWSLFSAFVRCF